jgi:hypothetical protein
MSTGMGTHWEKNITQIREDPPMLETQIHESPDS